MSEQNQNYFDIDEFDLGYDIKEAREESGGGGFVLLPESTYLAEIVKIQGWKSKNSDHKAAAVTMKIVDTLFKDEDVRQSVLGSLISDKVFLHVKFRVVDLNDAALGVSHNGNKLVKSELLKKRVTIKTANEKYDYTNKEGRQIQGESSKVAEYRSPAVFAGLAGDVGDDLTIDTDDTDI